MVKIQKITPHLWFDKEAREAAKFYTFVFPKSKIKGTTVIHNTPSGSVDIVTFELLGEEFIAISAGPLFKFTPAVSFHVKCKKKAQVDAIWEKLSADPKAEQCGWLKDNYGLSWQIEPTVLSKMLQDKDTKKVARVTQAFLKMKKLDIEKLKKAHEAN